MLEIKPEMSKDDKLNEIMSKLEEVTNLVKAYTNEEEETITGLTVERPTDYFTRVLEMYCDGEAISEKSMTDLLNILNNSMQIGAGYFGLYLNNKVCIVYNFKRDISKATLNVALGNTNEDVTFFTFSSDDSINDFVDALRGIKDNITASNHFTGTIVDEVRLYGNSIKYDFTKMNRFQLSLLINDNFISTLLNTSLHLNDALEKAGLR